MTIDKAKSVINELKLYVEDLHSYSADDVSETLEFVIKALEQTRWIPVSERLPEKNGKYLVTVRNGNVYAGVYDAFSGRFQCAATAWMPLPKSYTESESDTE